MLLNLCFAVIVAPDLDSLLDLFENETSKTVSCNTSRKGSGEMNIYFVR